MSLTRPSTSVLRILLVVATVATAAFTTAGSASAAIETAGSGTIAIGTGKTGKALGKAKIKVAAVEPATSSRNSSRAGAVTRVVAPASSVAVGRTSTVGLRGGIAFKRGKAKASFSKLNVKISSKRATVTALLAGKRINLFTGPAKALIDTVERRIRLSGAKVSLTAAAATALRTRLKVRRLFAGPVGTLSVSLRWTEIVPLVDPYFEQCGIAASSKLIGSLPAPAPLPDLTGAKTTVGAGVNWGFRSSFRGYIFGAGGSMQALDGAEVVQAGPFPSSFTWPNAPGSYAANDPVDMSDDQAIINSTGSVLFCNSPHNFRVVISNPTVVIDGDQGRIIADVDANFVNKWIPSQRIDLATLDLTGITPFYNRSGAEVTWSDVPVTLTQSGADAICGTGDAPLCDYRAGAVLDEITVESKTAYDTSDVSPGGALDQFVTANLPFPLTDPAQGGCVLPAPVNGQLTIDSAFAANAGAPEWRGTPENPAATPDLSSATPVTGGRFDWGLRESLRGTVNSSGLYNLSPGTTASNSYVGTGTGATAPPVPPGNPARDMGSNPARFFSWPASSSAGFYDPAGAGPLDDRLVLHTAGRIAFCQVEGNQSYGVVLSNPTAVIDGANSRVTVDVATRYRSSWVRGVVDIASLNLSQATITSAIESGTSTVQWAFPAPVANVGPVTLTADGEKVLNMLFKVSYIQGLGLSALTVRASFPEA
jgi:hypothetical protein